MFSLLSFYTAAGMNDLFPLLFYLASSCHCSAWIWQLLALNWLLLVCFQNSWDRGLLAELNSPPVTRIWCLLNSLPASVSPTILFWPSLPPHRLIFFLLPFKHCFWILRRHLFQLSWDRPAVLPVLSQSSRIGALVAPLTPQVIIDMFL